MDINVTISLQIQMGSPALGLEQLSQTCSHFDNLEWALLPVNREVRSSREAATTENRGSTRIRPAHRIRRYVPPGATGRYTRIW